MSNIISGDELEDVLKKTPEWESEGVGIKRTFEFEGFMDAMEFVNTVADVAAEADHHPDIDIRWNKVRLVLVTHSAGGLTDLDVEMAQRIDRLVD